MASKQIARIRRRATQAYLDTPVATSTQEMRGTTARIEDEPLVDLIHAVQLEAGHADVSMAGMLFTGAVIPKGQVTVRQIASLYVYENYLYAIEMNGAQLHEALEHAASFLQPWPFPSGEPVRLPSFSFDSAEGVNYTIDLRQPTGHRIVGLTFKGKPLADTQKLRVALINYRYSGGDNYMVYKGLPIVYRSTEEIRDLIIEHLARTRVIPTTSDHNWRIEPQEAVEALRRAALEQEKRASASAWNPSPNSVFLMLSLPEARLDASMLARPQHEFFAASGN